jgi:hypothetical protein
MAGKNQMNKTVGNRGYEERQQDFDKNWEIIVMHPICQAKTN